MNRFLICFASLAFLVSCQAPSNLPAPSPSPQTSPSPQVSPSPQTSPSPQVSPSPASSRPPITPGPEYNLASDSGQTFGAEWKERCNFSLVSTTDYLGGLDPKYPLAVCIRSAGERGAPLNPDWIMPYTSLFLGPVQTVYLLKEGDAVKELETVSQVKTTFAPIESPEEALSLLLATTPRVALLNANTLPAISNYQPVHYKVQSLEGTRVEKQGEDFLAKNILRNGRCQVDGRDVLAFSTDYLIRRNGEIESRQQTEIYTYGPCPIE